MTLIFIIAAIRPAVCEIGHREPKPPIHPQTPQTSGGSPASSDPLAHTKPVPCTAGQHTCRGMRPAGALPHRVAPCRICFIISMRHPIARRAHGRPFATCAEEGHRCLRAACSCPAKPYTRSARVRAGFRATGQIRQTASETAGGLSATPVLSVGCWFAIRSAQGATFVRPELQGPLL